MPSDPLFILAAIAAFVVLIILMVGIGGFATGSGFNRKYANKVMRLRIIAQALAIALILAFVLLRGDGG